MEPSFELRPFHSTRESRGFLCRFYERLESPKCNGQNANIVSVTSVKIEFVQYLYAIESEGVMKPTM